MREHYYVVWMSGGYMYATRDQPRTGEEARRAAARAGTRAGRPFIAALRQTDRPTKLKLLMIDESEQARLGLRQTPKGAYKYRYFLPL